jgi:hypothetical protein
MRIAHLLAIALAAWATGAIACGACLEDKVAAAFDYEVVSRAASKGQAVVFAEVQGPGAAKALVAAARKGAAAVPGVEAASVRTAEEPAALSFAFDVRRSTPASALAAAEKRAGVKGLRLVLLKVVP